MLDKNPSNQSGGSFTISSNGIYQYGTVTRVTTIVREYKDDQLVKETETITEYNLPTTTYPQTPYITY